MKTQRSTIAVITLVLTAAHAEAQNKTPIAGPPITPAQHAATLQGVAAGKAAAAQSAHDAAAALNRATVVAKAADVIINQTVKAVPGGAVAYAGGKALGNIIATQPVTIIKVPPLPSYHYTPPTLPPLIIKALPSLPAIHK